jgi:hypothetical protein
VRGRVLPGRSGLFRADGRQRTPSVSLGWVAGFLSGSDTSANALFGNLQVVAANQLQLNPILFAATNASADFMGNDLAAEHYHRVSVPGGDRAYVIPGIVSH